MTDAFTIAAIWLGLAVVATVLANHIRISTALVEICVGIAAGTIARVTSAPIRWGRTRTGCASSPARARSC